MFLREGRRPPCSGPGGHGRRAGRSLQRLAENLQEKPHISCVPTGPSFMTCRWHVSQVDALVTPDVACHRVTGTSFLPSP